MQTVQTQVGRHVQTATGPGIHRASNADVSFSGCHSWKLANIVDSDVRKHYIYLVWGEKNHTVYFSIYRN